MQQARHPSPACGRQVVALAEHVERAEQAPPRQVVAAPRARTRATAAGAEEIAKPLVKYDPEKAKQILEGLGWKDSGKGYREKDGQPLDLVFLAFSIARYKRMAEVAAPMLEA